MMLLHIVKCIFVLRAVYRGNDIVLLDDPLSAVDAVVSRHLFDEYVTILISRVHICDWICKNRLNCHNSPPTPYIIHP